MDYGDSVRSAWEAFCFDDGIGISQDIGRICFVDVSHVFPADDDDDEYGDGAAFLLLLRPIRYYYAVVRLAGFIDRTDMRRGAF